MKKNNFLNENPDLNITPLVDVMLVLLVVLMLIVPNLKYDENINLPGGSKNKISKMKKDDIRVLVTSEYVDFNNKKYNFRDFFDNILLNSQNLDKSKIVYLAGDKDISYDKLMQVLSALNKVGFSKISLQTK